MDNFESWSAKDTCKTIKCVLNCKELNSYLRCVLAVSMAKARTCRTTSDHGRVYIYR